MQLSLTHTNQYNNYNYIFIWRIPNFLSTIAKEAGGVFTEIDEFLSQSRLVAQSIMGKSIWRTPPSSNTGLRIEFKWVLHIYNLYNCMFFPDMAVVCLIFFVLGLAPGVILGEPTLPFCPCPSLPEVAFIWPEKCMAADFGSPETPVLQSYSFTSSSIRLNHIVSHLQASAFVF